MTTETTKGGDRTATVKETKGGAEAAAMADRSSGAVAGITRETGGFGGTGYNVNAIRQPTADDLKGSNKR